MGLLALLSAGAMAAEPPDLAQCRAIEAAAARLACYDALATQAVARAGEPAVVAEPPPPVKVVAARPDAVTIKPGWLDRSWEMGTADRSDTFSMHAYRSNYLLPLFYTTRPNGHPGSPAPDRTVSDGLSLQRTDAKFQISLKTKVIDGLFDGNGDLWLAYTQNSRWQLYDGQTSRPFRETNYEPEGMLVFRTDYDVLGWQGRLLSFGFNHQSNGRSLPLSRSWNRLTMGVGLEKGDWTLMLRPWWRASEGHSDDNPDISDYVGRGELALVRRFDRQWLSLAVRHSLRGGERSRGSLRADWAFPLLPDNGKLRAHLQWFSGYGESLIDYNHRGNYLGIGLSLAEGD